MPLGIGVASGGRRWRHRTIRHKLADLGPLVLGESLHLHDSVDPEVPDRTVALKAGTGEVRLRRTVNVGQRVHARLLSTTLQVEHTERLPDKGRHGGGGGGGAAGGGGGLIKCGVAHDPDKIVDSEIPSTSHCVLF